MLTISDLCKKTVDSKGDKEKDLNSSLEEQAKESLKVFLEAELERELFGVNLKRKGKERWKGTPVSG